MRRRPRQILLTFCALFLLGAQQAAYAHLIGHLGVGGQAVAQPADAVAHRVALSLSHLCTGCLAISALAAGAPPPVSISAAVEATDGIFVGFAIHHPLVTRALFYAARAPPDAL